MNDSNDERLNTLLGIIEEREAKVASLLNTIEEREKKHEEKVKHLMDTISKKEKQYEDKIDAVIRNYDNRSAEYERKIRQTLLKVKAWEETIEEMKEEVKSIDKKVTGSIFKWSTVHKDVEQLCRYRDHMRSKFREIRNDSTLETLSIHPRPEIFRAKSKAFFE